MYIHGSQKLTALPGAVLVMTVPITVPVMTIPITVPVMVALSLALYTSILTLAVVLMFLCCLIIYFMACPMPTACQEEKSTIVVEGVNAFRSVILVLHSIPLSQIPVLNGLDTKLSRRCVKLRTAKGIL